MKTDYKLLDIPVWQWFVLVVVIALVGFNSGTQDKLANTTAGINSDELAQAVLPEDGIILPVIWGDVGKQLVDRGVIDGERFEEIYESQGGLSDSERQLLYGDNNRELKVTRENAHVILNLLWAFGLANNNPILDEGPMQNPEYGGAGRFASTGGWTLSRGDSMDHYSKYPFVVLSPTQQALVEEVSKNIYRPCCNNSTHFPDCNHGMAMLGLLEIMASQGVDEAEMYEMALKVNSYWFPDTYLTIASYFANEGTSWDKVDAKQTLGFDYSSASGFGDVLAKVEPVSAGGGGSCGV
ncbi:hypothetical protein KKH05_00240 [Patescibacteria group bacterium]|nr:hypothetical protein [Patescibacteria group bacterium]